jgi:hypothetical protein
MVRSVVVAGAAVAVLAAGVAGAVPARACIPVRAFVDCAASTDGKGTEASPYNTLADVNRISLMPGDSFFLKRGTTCPGTLSPSGSGDPSEPIVIGAYGPGSAPPTVNAGGANSSVQLANQHDISISDLALSGGHDGVTVDADDYGPMSGITLQGLVIHNVTDGIDLQAPAAGSPSSLDNVTISGDRIYDITGDGVDVTSNWCRRPDIAPNWHPAYCTGAWAPGRGLDVSDNILFSIGDNGIAIGTTQDATVSDNWLEGYGGAGLSVADSTGATVTGNQVAGGQAGSSSPAAGTGYQIGPATDHATLEGNLSHDNASGFLQFDSDPQAPIGPVSVLGNMSIDDHGNDLLFAGGPVTNGAVEANTIYVGSGTAQEVASSTTDAPLDVQFAGNAVTAAPGAGTVGWNLPNSGWVVRDNLLHDIPVPAGSSDTITTSPGFAAPGGSDPFGYRLLAGSPALGSGVPVPASAAFPLSLALVPSNAPNIGAAQASAGPPTVLNDTFATDPEGAAPSGWTVTGPALVTANPAGFNGRSLTVTGPATAQHPFSATGGDVRLDLQMFAGQGDRTARVSILDTHGNQVLAIGMDPHGHLTYTDNGTEVQTAFSYPVAAWTDVSVLMYPSTGTYTFSADNMPVVTAKLTQSSGIPDAISVADPAEGAVFAVGDVMVSPACCPC